MEAWRRLGASELWKRLRAAVGRDSLMANRVYEKRFSAHPAFWLVGGAALLAIHVFFYFRIRALTGPGWASSLWLGWSLAMLELSFLARRTQKLSSDVQRKWTDRLASTWMVFISLAFIIFGIEHGIFCLLGAHSVAGFMELLAFALAGLIVILGVRQANDIQTVRLELATSKLPPGTERVRVAQISDLHLGPWVGRELLRQIVDKVNAAEPDIIVMTGDLADGPVEGHEEEAELLRQLNAGEGIFAVTGNHDYYDDIDGAVGFMEEAGMRVLCNEAVEAGGLIILGVDDDAHLIKSEWNLTLSEAAVLRLETEQQSKFLLLLRHRPIIEEGTKGHFDLQLSGHTHGGQLFPCLNSRHILAHHDRGLKKLKCGGCLYVSNGAGYVGPPVRLLAPPEIVVIDIVREK